MTTSVRRMFHMVVVASSLLIGCVEPGTHDPGYVAKQWSMMVREFGIVPIFPPREDVQVGDVYAMPIPPDQELQLRAVRNTNGRFLPIPVLLGTIDVSKDLEEYYKHRLSFPRTPGGVP